MTSFLKKVTARAVLAPWSDVADEISRKYFKGDGTDAYVRFTNGRSKPVKDTVENGPNGVVVFPSIFVSEQQAGSHRYVQVFDTVWKNVLRLEDISTDAQALGFIREINDTDIGSVEWTDADLKASKALFEKRKIGPTGKWHGKLSPAAWVLTYLRFGPRGEEEDGKDRAWRRLRNAGYDAIEDRGDGILVEYADYSMVYLVPAAYKMVALLDRREEETVELSAEEVQVLERYTPKWDEKEREPLDRQHFVERLGEMSEDDVAWQMANSKHADQFEADAHDKVGVREGAFLMMMNPNLSKSTRTEVASFVLERAGLSFVGGPNINTFVSALAKKGMVDRRLLKASEADALQDDIYYGKITDPDELRKISVKEYGYQLANNPHTPYDVLKRIAKEYYDDGAEMSWTGLNPSAGGKPGVNYRYGFKDAFKHDNFPTDELVKIYHRWKKKFPQKGALSNAESELLRRADLPQDLLKTLLKDHEDSLTAPPDALPAEEFPSFWKKLLAKHKAELKEKGAKKYATGVEYALATTAGHKDVTDSVLREILEWKERNDEDGHVIGAIADGKKAAFKALRDRKVLTDDEVVKRVREKLKFDGPDHLLVHFGEQAWVGKGGEPLKFKRVPDAERQKIEKEMRTSAAHDQFTFEVVDAFRLDKQIHKDFPKFAKNLGNVLRGVYHGTSLANAAGILASGVNVQAKERTGAMFGNGFYLASASSKAVQYASDNFSHEGLGVVFRMDAALGNSVVWKWGRPQKDELRYRQRSKDEEKRIREYAKKNGLKADEVTSRWHLDHDSVTAKAGMALLHDEYVVKSGQQVNIDTVIIVRKQKV